MPVETWDEMLAGQTHRRYIKAHTPLGGIPYYSDCTYLVVCRDLRDVFFSFLSHPQNEVGIEHTPLPDNPAEAFRAYVAMPFEIGVADTIALASFARHLESFWQYRDLPNIHMFHYTSMKDDLHREMRRMAAAVHIEIDEKVFPSLVEAASFENMKKNAEQFAPGAGTGHWKDDAKFFNKGTNEQ